MPMYMLAAYHPLPEEGGMLWDLIQSHVPSFFMAKINQPVYLRVT
jgi:hypothetical protein